MNLSRRMLSASLFPAGLFNLRRFARLAVFAGAVIPLPLLAQQAPRLPDLSAYDCAAVTPAATVETRRIGQVINGAYNEWNEVYVMKDGQRHLGCIALLRPIPRQMSAAEVKTFLTASMAIGAPAASTAETQKAAPLTAEPNDEPANIKPEPLKRLRKPLPGTAETKSSAEEDVPPLPAEKTFDGARETTLRFERQQPAILSEGTQASPATIGVEDREFIPQNQSYPWNTLAYLSVNYPNGAGFRCTATLVSAYVALTAGHCIHNNNRGGYAATVRVSPGQSQAAPKDNTPLRPYGTKSDVQSLQTTARWTQISGEESYFISDYRNDIAAIEFATPFSHTRTFMPVIYGSTSTTVTSAGYPGTINGDKNNYGPYGDTGLESSNSVAFYHAEHVREFAVDASGGNSGGPFIYADPSTGQRYLVGILSYTDDLDNNAGGPWYDSWNQTLVSGWVSWTPGAASVGSVSGLRVASVFSSTQSNLISFLRFYNAGTSAGTVDVTLADYVTGNILAMWTSPSLPANSARQFLISEIEDNASATFAKPLVYSISVRPTFNGKFQNVLLRKTDATVTNISSCDVTALAPTTATNVHSSILQSNYPSAVVVHNTGGAGATPTLSIYNAQSGALLGTYRPSSPIPPNGQLILNIPQIEAGAGISPGTSIYHYNIRLAGSTSGYLQHLVNNAAAGVTSDMSVGCTLAPTP